MPHTRLKHTALFSLCLFVGCGNLGDPQTTLLLSVPLTVNGEAVGEAYVDTGGGYEILLKEDFGLRIIDTIVVLAFGGEEEVLVTEPFRYSVGDYHSVALSAIVGLSACDCNGLGFHFFRRTGIVLGIDFPKREVEFLLALPDGDAFIPFAPPPESLLDFESAFIEVEVTSGEESQRIIGLLDTGANVTVIRQGIVGRPSALSPDQLDIAINHESLGTVVARVGLFDTPGLPDIIIGTDVMRTWADKWHFDFTPGGGAITVVFSDEPSSTSDDGGSPAADDL